MKYFLLIRIHLWHLFDFYAFDLVPAYWKELNKHINSGRIVVLDIVKDEIDKGNDDLAKWIADLDQLTVVPKVTEKTVGCVWYDEKTEYKNQVENRMKWQMKRPI